MKVPGTKLAVSWLIVRHAVHSANQAIHMDCIWINNIKSVHKLVNIYKFLVTWLVWKLLLLLLLLLLLFSTRRYAVWRFILWDAAQVRSPMRVSSELDRCLPSIERHLGSYNPDLESKQRLRSWNCWPHYFFEVVEWTFKSVCGLVEVRSLFSWAPK